MSHRLPRILFAIAWLITMGVAPTQNYGEGSTEPYRCEYGCGTIINPRYDPYHMCKGKKEAEAAARKQKRDAEAAARKSNPPLPSGSATGAGAVPETVEIGLTLGDDEESSDNEHYGFTEIDRNSVIRRHLDRVAFAAFSCIIFMSAVVLFAAEG